MEVLMYKSTIRKVGGSMMLAIPPALMNLLGLSSGSSVDISMDKGRLVIQPSSKPKYQLDELLNQCDPHVAPSAEDREWLHTPSAGKEII